jgi:hypothetical protein
MKEKNTLQISGGLIFWTVRGDTNVDKLAEGLKRIGMGHLAPERTAYVSTLKDALEWELGTKATRLVRPLKTKDGFVVVDEERGDSKNDYANILTARVNDAGVVTFSGSKIGPHEGDSGKGIKGVLETFEEFKDQLKTSQVTSMMVKVVNTMAGVSLRPNGALYFLPEQHMGDWRKLAEVVESAGSNDCYIIRAPMDKDTLKAVRDGITTDTMAAAKSIEAEVESGELGAKALQTRVENAKALRERIGEYEGLLKLTLDDLRKAVDVAEDAAATAVLVASAKAAKEAKQEQEKRVAKKAA